MLATASASAVSAWFDLKAGTPQGGVLSPFFFLVKTAPIWSSRRSCLLQFFADDMSVAPPAGIHGADGDKALNRGLDMIAYDLRMSKFSLEHLKCVVVSFSLRVARPLPIVIEGVVLKRAERVKYLGVLLNSTWSWSDHVAYILGVITSKLKSIAKHISASSPRWPIVVLLFKALIMPRPVYGMPVFAPTPAESAKMATCIAKGIYKILGISGNASTMMVLQDNGLLSPALEFELTALRYAHRLWLARTLRNPAATALLSQLRARPHPTLHAHATARSVLKAVALFGVEFDIDDDQFKVKSLRKTALTEQRRRFLASPARSPDEKVRKALLPADKPAEFYKVAKRAGIATLSAFRYNRLQLNHLTWGAGRLAHCRRCPGTSESVKHVLLSCPQYAVARAECQRDLAAIGARLDHSTLLAGVEYLPQDQRRRALRVIVKYLDVIRRIRRV